MGEQTKLTCEDVLRIVVEARKKGDRADLSRADLSRADLSRADLSDADLRYADLCGAPTTDERAREKLAEAGGRRVTL